MIASQLSLTQAGLGLSFIFLVSDFESNVCLGTETHISLKVSSLCRV